MAKRNLEFALISQWWILLVVFLGVLNSAASFTLSRQQYQLKQNDGPVSYNTSNFQEPQSGCTSDRLAMYKIVLHTYWTRELFPKHYPDWRPPAQWTKTIGRSHDSSYVLFRLGQLATPGVRLFAETGKTDSIDNQASLTAGTSSTTSRQSVGGQRFDNGIFDEFTFSAIPVGEGRSEGRFFADGNHSLVSLMTRILPSPDWFIGVDSFQLCVGGTWIDTVTVEMDPLDAGTDNGFTFTAPNWPTDPQGVIYRMTSRYPAHQASSFYYPKSKRLPPIATFQFIKMKEYELSDVFNFGEDDRKYETVETRTHLESEHNHVEMNNELSASIERERQNEVTVVPVSYSERDKVRARMLAKMNPQKNTTETLDSIDVLPKNNKKAIFNNISQHYETRKQRKRVSWKPRDCRVSHWSEWSPCSKTCGIGDMHRYRKVIKYAKRGGRPCPPLQESKWCGSSRDCKPATYFNWNPTS